MQYKFNAQYLLLPFCLNNYAKSYYFIVSCSYDNIASSSSINQDEDFKWK